MRGIGGLGALFRPASSAATRYWKDHLRLAVKCAMAAVVAWTLAKYAAGQPDPYFAPLAALLGVYPTVGRSLRESVQYVGGFVLGAALAIPTGVLLGPGIAGIAVVVLLGVLIASWRRLGDQGAQVTFTALFALLLGGHQPLHYVTNRASEVAIGVVTGLVINIVVFPPLELRPAAQAIRKWGITIAAAMEALGDATADRRRGRELWPGHDRQLSRSAEQARAAMRHERESPRWSQRAVTRRGEPEADAAILDLLDVLTARTRAVARSMLDVVAEDLIPASFGEEYARLLRLLADGVREVADQARPSPSGQELAALSESQQRVEHEAGQVADRGDDASTAQRLARLAADMIGEFDARRA
jgi:uncharacterized membrane protein YccC